MKRNFRWLALAAGLLAVPAGAAVSEQSVLADVAFSASGHTLTFSRQDQFDREAPATNLLLHETRLRTDFRQYGVGVQFASRLNISDPRADHKPFTLEKKFAVADWEQWKLTLGDSHFELGRGLALSLYTDSVFGVDNSLEGVAVAHRTETFKGGVFGGRVNALREPVALNPLDSPLRGRDVWLAGGHATARVAGPVSLGGHYLFAANRREDTGEVDKVNHTVGATFAREGVVDGVDAYLESNVLFTRLASGERLANGYGTYGSLTWVPLPWRVKLEGKDYRNYRFDFRRPPTLEEDIVETLNASDVSAARLTTEYRFLPSRAQVRLSYLLGDDRIKKAPIHHPVAGGQLQGPARTTWEWSAGYRLMPQVTDLTHGAVKVKLPTGQAQAVELGVQRLFTRSELASPVIVRQEKGLFNLTYTFSSRFNAGLGYEYVPTNDAETGRHFASLEAALRLGAFGARAFLGKTSGGTLCSGGVCRQVPPFSGGLLESTYTF